MLSFLQGRVGDEIAEGEKGIGKVDALYRYVLRLNVDLGVGEVPDALHASCDQTLCQVMGGVHGDGEDANEDLKALSEKIMGQVLGEEYTEEYLDVPVEETGDAQESDMPEADTSEETAE